MEGHKLRNLVTIVLVIFVGSMLLALGMWPYTLGLLCFSSFWILPLAPFVLLVVVLWRTVHHIKTENFIPFKYIVAGPVLFAFILLFIAAIVFGGFGYWDLSDLTFWQHLFTPILTLSLFLSIFVGGIVFCDSVIHLRKTDMFTYIPFLGGSLLLIAPQILLFKISPLLTIPFFAIAGVLLAIHGYFELSRKPFRGFVYLYFSAVFLIFAPFLAWLLSDAVIEIAKTRIYYHTEPDYISCHLPAIPIFPSPLLGGYALGSAAAGGGAYVGILGLICGHRRNNLKEKLQRNGTLPPEIGLCEDREAATLIRKL